MAFLGHGGWLERPSNTLLELLLQEHLGRIGAAAIPCNVCLPIQEVYARWIQKRRLGATLVSRLLPCELCHEAPIKKHTTDARCCRSVRYRGIYRFQAARLSG